MFNLAWDKLGVVSAYLTWHRINLVLLSQVERRNKSILWHKIYQQLRLNDVI